jgi:hypothetical protein
MVELRPTHISHRPWTSDTLWCNLPAMRSLVPNSDGECQRTRSAPLRNQFSTSLDALEAYARATKKFCLTDWRLLPYPQH